MGVFERYLSLWIALAIGAGVYPMMLEVDPGGPTSRA